MKKNLIVLMGLLILPLWATPTHRIEPSEAPIPVATVDPRIEKLNRFFDHYKCKQPRYVNDYIASADKYNIPYSLLPAISLQESTCGQHQLYNNWWGYWSDTKGFKSVPQGIEFVSSELSGGWYYRDKTINQKLHVYNPNPDYAPKVEQLQKQIENP